MEPTDPPPRGADDAGHGDRGDAGRAAAPARRARRGGSSNPVPPGVLAISAAFVIAAAVGVAWPDIATELRVHGVDRPDRIIHLVGALILLAAAVMLAVGAAHSTGRRRIGLGTIATGAGLLSIGTAAMTLGAAPTVGVITAGGLTVLQVLGVVLLIAGVVAMPSNASWGTIALVDAGLAVTTALALTWLAPLRVGTGPDAGPLDVAQRQPTALLLVVLTLGGVIYLVRVVQAPGPGDMAIVVAVLLIPSAFYTSVVGQSAGPGAVAFRGSVLWWLCGPGVLAIAGFQAMRARSRPAAIDPEQADTRRATRAEWVAVIAMLLTLGAVATHRLFIDSLDPVLLALGVVAVLLSTFRLTVLQREQVALQQRLGALALELHERARTDELTGLGNRAALVEALDRLMSEGAPVHVFYADVDDFKTVNDALGHETGDRLLVLTAHRLTDVFGPSTYRVGGDEFVAVHPDLSPADAADLARSIVAITAEPVDIDGVAVSARLSIGVAHSGPAPDGGAPRNGDELLRMADLALNRAKELGRARACSYDAWLQDRADRRLIVQQGLRRAVDRDEFEVRYRPVVDLETGDLLAAEAVVRWETPDRHLLLPTEYFEIAADTGLVPAISRSNLRLAAAPWLSTDPPDVPLSISLTLPELVHGGLVDDLDHLLGSIPRSSLRLQIPESALMDPVSQPSVDRLVERQYGICVRDFGTAASSLRRLSRLPEPSIRIDRSFVAGLNHRVADRLILEAVVGIGAELRVQITADGVTQPGQATLLRELGIRRAQGWLFGRPSGWPDFVRQHLRPERERSPLEWRPGTTTAAHDAPMAGSDR
ncbi:putative bifunctional diguanylate cyclase/phosphodiesterase [Dermatobacter hominis]|uniref:putative bifunctional diguanylate cyclase/phosphodiesterase n=1 Tax=Dermatobacter hominis TaxID=2884263 RepID=UPI001D10EF56|nr:EAL domain-containing protein [Dermatobacter hominis]UDY34758.1 EAL domain-containing protein [Dermatobacter hominis]